MRGGGGTVPVGTIIPFVGKTTPERYLFCDGSTFSRTDYPELYTVLESTTLPDLDERFLEGSSTPRTLKNAGLPNITGELHRIMFANTDGNGVSGAFDRLSVSGWYSPNNGSQTRYGTVSFSANEGATTKGIYGSSDTVQPKSYTVRYLIRAK